MGLSNALAMAGCRPPRRACSRCDRSDPMRNRLPFCLLVPGLLLRRRSLSGRRNQARSKSAFRDPAAASGAGRAAFAREDDCPAAQRRLRERVRAGRPGGRGHRRDQESRPPRATAATYFPDFFPARGPGGDAGAAEVPRRTSPTSEGSGSSSSPAATSSRTTTSSRARTRSRCGSRTAGSSPPG